MRVNAFSAQRRHRPEPSQGIEDRPLDQRIRQAAAGPGRDQQAGSKTVAEGGALLRRQAGDGQLDDLDLGASQKDESRSRIQRRAATVSPL
jgi:hypothetical protein